MFPGQGGHPKKLKLCQFSVSDSNLVQRRRRLVLVIDRSELEENCISKLSLALTLLSAYDCNIMAGGVKE